MDSLNPRDRQPSTFDIQYNEKFGEGKPDNGRPIYGTKIIYKWREMLEAKAAEAGMSLFSYVQSKVEEKFPVDMQVRLAQTHGVTLAHQRRELFMHVWPDLPKWNVWSTRVFVSPNSPKLGRPSGSKSTKSTYHKPECVDEPPMRNAYNDVVLKPEDYLTVREMAESKGVPPQMVVAKAVNLMCTNYRAAKAAEQAEDL